MQMHKLIPSVLALACALSAQSAPVERAQAPSAARAGSSVASSRVLIGVTMNQVDEALADQLGVEADDVVLIESVTPGYGAQKAGIRAHDVITKLDGKSPVTMDRVREILRGKRPGDKIRVTVARSKGEKEFTVELMGEGTAVAASPDAPTAPANPHAAVGSTKVAPPTPPATTDWRQQWPLAVGHAQGFDEESLRSQLAEAKKHIAEAQALLTKHTGELARNYSKMADELSAKARGKVEDAFDEKRLAELHSLIETHANEARKHIESDLKPRMDAHMKSLGQLFQEYHGMASLAPGLYRSGTDKYVVMPQAQAQPGAIAGSGLGGATTPQAVAGQGPLVYASGGNISAKTLDKMGDRLGGIEKRLERIEAMLESLVDGDKDKGEKKKRDR